MGAKQTRAGWRGVGVGVGVAQWEREREDGGEGGERGEGKQCIVKGGVADGMQAVGGGATLGGEGWGGMGGLTHGLLGFFGRSATRTAGGHFALCSRSLTPGRCRFGRLASQRSLGRAVNRKLAMPGMVVAIVSKSGHWIGNLALVNLAFCQGPRGPLHATSHAPCPGLVTVGCALSSF